MSTELAHIEKKKSLTPKLRFRGFDKTWDSQKLETICDKLSVGFVGTCERYYTDKDNGVLLVRTGNLSNGLIKLDNVKYVLEEFHLKNKKSQIFPGDLLIARHGSSGQAALVPKNFPESNCLNIVILRAKNSFDSYFLQNKFNSSVLQKQIEKKTAGSTQGVINTGELATLDITFPSLPEQQKIASFLSAVDEKIQQLTRKKEPLEQYKKGVMQQLFSGKLRFKDENGKPYPKWEEKELGEISSISTGSSNRQDSGLDGEFTFFDRSQDIRTSAIYLFDGEAIIVAGEGQEFVPKYFVGKFDLHQRTYAIMNYKDSIGKYLFFYIYFHRNYFFSQAVGSTVKSLRLPMFQKMKIKLPCIEEQQKIASFLTALDAKIESVAAQIAHTQTFKKGLLQQMFV